MTTPNKITLFRILIIPIMVIIAVIPQLNKTNLFLDITISQLMFLILFIIGSLSDFLDGYLARKNNQITTFGKFLDPIADKLLVVTSILFLCLFPYWAGLTNYIVIYTGLLIIIIREFLVTGVRLLAIEKQKVIAASKLGKIKTATTMVAITVMLFNGFHIHKFINKNSQIDYISYTLYAIAILFTIISGIDYLIKNKDIVLESI